MVISTLIEDWIIKSGLFLCLERGKYGGMGRYRQDN